MAYPFYPAYSYNSYLPQGYHPTQQQQTQSGIIWVTGAQEAQMYPVAPNNAVALWEQSGKVIYLKSADATGKPTLRIFDLVERTETPNTASFQQDGKTLDYATKDELSAVSAAIKNALSDIDQIKGDLYGLSGKRKLKKQEATDDDE